ncbi:MAG: hypothetical protein JRG76_20190 [Deltaproteobacteria bacterium]|nr:hypothetical protein [Deltaproteobacteria bacterium]
MSARLPYLLLLPLITALAWSAPASAEDLAVRYRVHEKSLKQTHPDSLLRFELHANASCSNLLHMETARLETVLDTPALGSPLFLIVTGEGIEPLGPECQVQMGSGLPGPRGPAGPSGSGGSGDGPPGPAGATGSAGPTGPAGADGSMGPAGAAGADGSMGPAGASGAMGPAGPMGGSGPMGPAGAAGRSGSMGGRGPAGAPGLAGMKGDAGPQGPAGPAGAQGETGPTGPDPFADYQYASSESVSATTALVYQNKLSVTTADLPAGNYRIGYSLELTSSHRAGTSDFRIRVDGATTLTEASSNAPGSSNRFSTYGGFSIQPLAAGVHSIEVDFKANAANTASIRRARVEIYPVP